MTLRIQLLGNFRIWRDGTLVPADSWPTQKSKALVKILLTERGRFVSADRLTEWLWRDVPPEKALNNLWVAVSQAKRVLQPDLPPRASSGFLHTGREGYWFAPTSGLRVEVDVEEFTEHLRAARIATDISDRIAALEAARSLYGGPYLEEDPYEDWTLPTRERLAEEFLALLADLADACAAQGRYGRAIGLCQESLDRDRLREATYRNMMLYHYCAGEQQLALAVYKQCRRVLQEEAEMRPSPETTRLYRQIQRRDLEPSGGQPTYPKPTPFLPESYSLGRTPLVGREREYALLARLITETADGGSGGGHVVLVEGEPGIGKSRLVQEAAGYAGTRGVRTLLTNCYQIEQAMPYQPVIDLVTQILENTLPEMLARVGEGALAEIATLMPGGADDAGRRLPTRASADDLPEARQSRLSRAILRLLDAFAGEGSLLVAVDDIHWADDASLRFLHHLARQAARRRILLICTCRPEEMAADERLISFLHGIKREPGTRSLPLARLSFADAHSLLAALADPALHTRELGEWLHRETDGNPFFLLSILQSLLEQGLVTASGASAWKADPGALYAAGAAGLTLPEALCESVRARILRLPPNVRPVLDAAAVLGRRFNFALLRGLTGEPDAALLDGLDLLVRRHLLREEPQGDSYDFSHDKVREVVYRDLGGTRRILLHRAAAEALEAQPGGADERAALAAEHFERGQVWGNAITCLARAAERSLELFALREALQYFDRAIALAQAHPNAADRRALLELFERRGGARAQAGQTEGAVADLGVALDAARQTGDPSRERDLLIRLGMAYRRADSYSQALRCLEAALAAARASGDKWQAADTLYHLGTVAWSDGDNVRAIAFHDEAVALSQDLRLTDLVAVQALHGRGESYFADALPEAAIGCFEKSLGLARAIGDRSYECENHMMIGYACTGSMGLADYERARECFQAAQAIVEASQLEWHSGPVGIGLAHARACLGEYQEAWDSLNEMLRRLEALGLVRYRIMACCYAGCLLQDLNLPERAAGFHEEGLRLAEEKSVTFWVPLLRADLARDELRSGRMPDDAALREALDKAQAHRENYLAARCLEVLAEISLACGKMELALAYADALRALAERGGMREIAAVAQLARGRTLAAAGSGAAAETELLSASALADRIGRVRLCWEIHDALSSLYRGQGRDAEADRHDAAARGVAARIDRNLRDLTLRSVVVKTY
jgi:DNA-binding SARP family transcriptional activator